MAKGNKRDSAQPPMTTEQELQKRRAASMLTIDESAKKKVTVRPEAADNIRRETAESMKSLDTLAVMAAIVYAGRQGSALTPDRHKDNTRIAEHCVQQAACLLDAATEHLMP